MTGRLPGFAMFHVGMEVRLTQSVEPPDGVVDAIGNVVGVDFHAHEPLSHGRHFSRQVNDSGAEELVVLSIVVLHRLPQCVYVKLHDCQTEFLLPMPCDEHSVLGADRACLRCKFFPGVLAVKPFTNRRSWTLCASCTTDNNDREVKVRRTQLPVV